MRKKAIVAMSGGVDSSVAAYLMQQAGYEVSGAIMKLFDTNSAQNEKGKLRGTDNIEDARKVADRLGIELGVFDMRPEFRAEVIERFIAAYEGGQTPNPCVFCNKKLKFEDLYNKAASLPDEINPGADDDGLTGEESSEDKAVIATGHYAVIEYDEKSGRYKLKKAADSAKDQSYFLYTLSQEQLSRTVFPLGALNKQEVRAIAEEQGFVTAKKKESQDICFIPDGDYAAFIEGYTGCDYPAGDFVDEEGNVMGSHKGIINYTVGQRKGLGLALKKPAYVLRLDAENNRVVLGDNETLFKRELTARDFNWLSTDAPDGPIRASARIRYRHREAPCEIIPLTEAEPDSGDFIRRVRIVFDEPQRAITRGQSVVIYDGEYVLGGGIIE
ncbi:MAG: tRNA 2-thiouridine(34) synthase MnmA [Mogibacterium sp.]|nr:tRNA 2-thiouridine(34) synthase MnmA [Mogibacterium sp.]